MSISFDELIKKAKDVAVTAGRVAGDVVVEVVDGSKAKLAEAKLSSEIREVTERLGSIVYEAAKTGRDSIKLQEMLINELDNLYRELDSLSKKEHTVNTEITCAKCGEKNSNHSLFCCKCGAKLAEEPKTEYAVEADIPEYTADEAMSSTAAEVEAIAAEAEAVVAEVKAAVDAAVDSYENKAEDEKQD